MIKLSSDINCFVKTKHPKIENTDPDIYYDLV